MKRFVTTLAVLGLAAAPGLAAGGYKTDDSISGHSSYSAKSEGPGPVDASHGPADPTNTLRVESTNLPVVNTSPATAKLVAAQDLAGADLWVMDGTYDATAWDRPHPFEATSAAWRDIGKVSTLAITADGAGAGLVARIGGFMDVKDKPVFLRLGDIRILPAEHGGYAVVTRRTEAQLAQQPEANIPLSS